MFLNVSDEQLVEAPTDLRQIVLFTSCSDATFDASPSNLCVDAFDIVYHDQATFATC